MGGTHTFRRKETLCGVFYEDLRQAALRNHEFNRGRCRLGVYAMSGDPRKVSCCIVFQLTRLGE